MRYPSLITSIAAAALLASPAVATAQSAAATKPAASAVPAKPTPAAVPAVPAATQAAVPVTEAKAGLLKEAKVQPAEAQKTALAHVPNGTVTKAEIEREHTKLIYSYDLAVPGRSGLTEVHVDAMTGKILSTEHEKSVATTATPAAAPAKPATMGSMSKPTTAPAPSTAPKPSN